MVTKCSHSKVTSTLLVACAFMQFSLSSLFIPQEEIPNILKQRKQLAKLVLDYDSAKARYIWCLKYEILFVWDLIGFSSRFNCFFCFLLRLSLSYAENVHILLAFRYKAAKSNNSQAMAGKLEPLKDEMDEALNKVEICKVNIKLFIFPSTQFELLID